MVEKIILCLLFVAGVLSLQAQSSGKKADKALIVKGYKSPIQKSVPIPDELNTRIKMVTDRIVFGDEPKLTEDFLLACVTLDPQFSRRFTEFSGDQCGRYLSAFSRIKIPGNPVDLGNLARKIALAQRSDGRFGNDTLDFSNHLKLSGLHMALLWGNGRLLTGLMDYYAVSKAPDFLISGGVPEFFDAKGPKKGSRDEGCSEADFVMVSLELWKATEKVEYLERAEYCLYNELMYNQFDSGDFGSHPISQNFGFELATSQWRCWWCCDYHGLQAPMFWKPISGWITNTRVITPWEKLPYGLCRRLPTDIRVQFSFGSIS